MSRCLWKVFVVSLLIVGGGGCASTKIEKSVIQSMQDPGKTTIVSYSSIHLGNDLAFSSMGLVGAVVGQVVKDDEMMENDAYVTSLNEKCIAAIESILISTNLISYSSRSSVNLPEEGLSATDRPSFYKELQRKYGISSMINITLNYGVGYGIPKPMCLRITWDIYSPDGTKQFRVKTDSYSEKTRFTTPNTMNPQFEETFIELSRQNAIAFANRLHE